VAVMIPKKGRLLSSPMSCAERVDLCSECRWSLALPFTFLRLGREVVKRVVSAMPGVDGEAEEADED
jgi:hypothetical protein